MNNFKRSIKQVFAGAVDALKTFPASIGCAFGFAIVTIIRIQLDWPQQEPFNFLFNCLHWSFALGAIFSLMLITGAQSRFNTGKTFLAANVIGVGAAGLTFLLLYLFAGTDPAVGARYETISALAVARVSMVMLVSYLVFVVLAGIRPEADSKIGGQEASKIDGEEASVEADSVKGKSDFAKAFFMSHKAFFIAAIYGLVIMAGASGVAGAVQVLLYHDMSSKVYLYISTLTGLLAFTLFVGYFPDFRKGEIDGHREVAEKQPRFIEILFGTILVPLVMALTLVLLIWAGKTILSGMAIPIERLSGIAAAYTIGGIWLHMMVTHHETGLAKFYKKYYPVAALVILVFEAWALINQLMKSGLKLTEYWFILVWVVAAAGAILLILLKDRAHTPIVVITCVLAILSVLPLVGYNVLPVNAQVNRLETLLVNENMLQDNQIVTPAAEPELAIRQAITDATEYIAFANDAKLPVWFSEDLGNDRTFRKTFGFDKVWPKEDITNPQPSDYVGISLYLPAGPVDISGYHWAVSVQQEFQKEQTYVTVEGEKGTYRIYWDTNTKDGIPILTVQLNDQVILEKNMNEYIDMISAKYPANNMEPMEGDVADMKLVLESPEISVLLVFRNLEFNLDPQNDVFYYNLNVEALYMNEKN